MSKTLDLRFNGKLNSEISPMFNKLSTELRKQFNGIVSEISQSHKTNLNWWLQGPASRNTFSSPFFHHYCVLHLLKELIESKKLTYQKLLVDSEKFGNVILNLLSDSDVSHCEVEPCRGTLKFRLKQIFKPHVIFVLKIMQHVIAKISGNADMEKLEGKQLILIDTFMTSAFTNNDRWYGVFWNELKEKLKSETYFIPTIVSTSINKLLKTYKELRNNRRNFLIKEDFLEISDYVYAFQYKKRIKDIYVPPVMVLDLDLTAVVKDEIQNSRDLLSIVESLLMYRFIYRLKQSGVKVRLAIDWFEGQIIDKAWNFGFNKFFPEVKKIGYRGFESFPFYLCSFPLPVERDAEVLPDVMAVQGFGSIATLREFMPDLEVMVIPSFKSQHVWDYDSEQQNQAKISVLITLPISQITSVRIIKRILKAYNKMQSKLKFETVSFIIKPHPTHVLKKISSILPHLPKAFVISGEKSFPKLLRKTSVLITEASNTCFEALACGVPVIIIENEEGLTFNPNLAMIPETIFRIVRTIEQLGNALQKYIFATSEQLAKQKKIGKQVRKVYFEPLSDQGIQRFLDLKNEEYVKYA